MSKRRLSGRTRRKLRIRKKIWGTEERPRLTVFRSMRHMYAQLVNDNAGETMAAASTQSKELQDTLKGTGNMDAAKAVGRLIAQKASEKGIKKVVFDRNGFYYKGRIKSLADAARESGLEF